MVHRYLVHYGEIALKGRNRRDFEHKLIENIKKQQPVQRVRRMTGRMVAESQVPVDLGKILGIAWWAPVEKIEAQVEAIRAHSLRIADSHLDSGATFAVRVTRADKSFPLKSQQLEALVGGDIDERYPVKVDLDEPDFTLHIEIAEGAAYLFSEKFEGRRGLPAGISGLLVGLYSAGIDSATAAYLMGKRGASIELVHFYAQQDAEIVHQGKAGQLAKVIAGYFPSLTIHYIPYHHFQLATMELDRHQKQELVLFRRFMARVAEQIALERRALGLFTGDNLGQVASQTLENLTAVDRAVSTSIFRPLVAYDKQEIIDLGIDLGFFDLANQDYKDCCSIIAKHPATKANMEHVEYLEDQLDIQQVIERSLTEVSSYHINPEEQSVTVEGAPSIALP